MEIKQIYDLMNTVTKEVLGTEGLVKEDLTNVVDVGKAVMDANSVDAYARSLVNHIGKVVFVNRNYSGFAPSVLMDAWEYGSILEKITVDALPDAVESKTWDLQDGQSVDPYVFHAPKVSAKFYNNRVTFDIEMSFTTKQIKQSFSDATQLNAFISMIETAIENSMTVKLDGLIQRTLNNAIAETLADEFPSGKYGTKSGTKAVNLLQLYNEATGQQLPANKCMTSPEFIRFASLTMNKYVSRLGRISTLFNIGKKPRFTPSDRLHMVMLSDFESSANSYLQSDTFHNEFTKLPGAETVPYWQGSGQAYSFEDISSVHVKTSAGHDVQTSGILAVMFDREALGVTNMDRRVTSAYNPKGEYYNNFYKMDAGYFNDLNENVVVFFVSDSKK